MLLQVLFSQVLEVALREGTFSLSNTISEICSIRDPDLSEEYLDDNLAFLLVDGDNVTESAGFTVHLNLGLKVVLLFEDSMSYSYISCTSFSPLFLFIRCAVINKMW